MNDRLDAIAELWPSMTAKAIGARLGITKNTVCGIVFKARLAGDERFPPRRGGKEAVPMAAPGQKQPARITELRAHECRYPVRSGAEKGDHWFCGARRAAGSWYCETHRELCDRPKAA